MNSHLEALNKKVTILQFFGALDKLYFVEIFVSVIYLRSSFKKPNKNNDEQNQGNNVAM